MPSLESAHLRQVPSADLHLHATMRRSDETSISETLTVLKKAGLERLWVYAHVVPIDAAEYGRRLSRLPVPDLHRYTGNDVEDSFDGARIFVRSLGDGPQIDVIPMVHAVGPAVAERLDDILAGIDLAAVKLVHDPTLLGEPRDRLEAQHMEVLARLAPTGVLAIVHLDLRTSEVWLRRVLAEIPQLRLTIAHLGYSRSRMGPLLDEFPNLLTDVANLAVHMETQPESYRAFLERYSGRVVFGSDAFLGDLSGIVRHAAAVRALRLPPAAEDNILRSSAALVSR